MTIQRLGLGVATVAAVTMLALAAHAQSGAPPAAPGATKAPAIAKTPPPPAPAAGKAEVKTEVAKKADAKKGASACVGLEQAACAANTTCQWIAAVKRKDGRETRAYCRITAAAAKNAKATAVKK